MSLPRLSAGAGILWLFAAAVQAGPPSFKAEVAEPVVEELMGGCSLKCAFPWQVEVIVPGQKPQATRVLNDNSAESGWVAPAGVTGVGVRFHFLFPKKLPQGMDGQVPLYGLDLVNGHWKDEDSWKEYGRIKKARLWYNDRAIGEVTFADSRRWEKVSFPDILVHNGDSMALEVLEIYPGSKAGLAVSEVVLQGAH